LSLSILLVKYLRGLRVRQLPNRGMIQAYSARMDKDWNERFEKAQPKPGAARIYIGAVILFVKVILELVFGFQSRRYSSVVRRLWVDRFRLAGT
jgi:hypothetical protein